MPCKHFTMLFVLATTFHFGACLSYDGSTGGLGNRIRAMSCAISYARSHNLSIYVENNHRHGLTHILNFDSFGLRRQKEKTYCTHLNETKNFRVLPFGAPLRVPLLPHVIARGIHFLHANKIVTPFACIHHRTFERGVIPTFSSSYRAFMSTLANNEQILVIHDGHVLPNVHKSPRFILKGPNKLHRHGIFDEHMDYDTMESVIACSYASSLLLRNRSTLGNLIEGTAFPGARVSYYT
jgi:hypothetical protein